METIYFVLGMLSIVGAAFVAAIVWGIVKITKLLKANRGLEEWIVGNDRHMHDNINSLHKDLDQKSDELYRRISIVTEELHRDMKDLDREMDKRTDELDRNINDRATNIISYVDSRVDKALGLAGAKQVIKG